MWMRQDCSGVVTLATSDMAITPGMKDLKKFIMAFESSNTAVMHKCKITDYFEKQIPLSF